MIKVLIFYICYFSVVLGGETGYRFTNDKFVNDIFHIEMITDFNQGNFNYYSNLSGRLVTEFVEKKNNNYKFLQTWNNLISTYRRNDEMKINHEAQKLNGTQFIINSDSTGEYTREGVGDGATEMEEQNTALLFFTSQENIMYPFGPDSLRLVGDTWTNHTEEHFEEFPGFEHCKADLVGDAIYAFNKVKTKKGKIIAYISKEEEVSISMLTQTWDEAWKMVVIGILNTEIQYNVTDKKFVKYRMRGTLKGDGTDLEDDSSIFFSQNMDILCKRKLK